MLVATLLGRLLIGGLFLFSGYQKLSIPLENFEEVLRIYEVFPEFSIYFLSRFVPVMEVFIGGMLVVGFLTRLMFAVSALFFAVFIFVLSRGLLLKLPLEDCGCFGEWIQLPPQTTLGMDIFFLIFSVYLLSNKTISWGIDSWLKNFTKSSDK